jgi:hypothetical protein
VHFLHSKREGTEPAAGWAAAVEKAAGGRFKGFDSGMAVGYNKSIQSTGVIV